MKGYDFMTKYVHFVNEEKMKFILPVASDVAGKRIDSIVVLMDCTNATFSRAT